MENSVLNNRAKVIGAICKPIKLSNETYGESFYIFTVSVPRVNRIAINEPRQYAVDIYAIL